MRIPRAITEQSPLIWLLIFSLMGINPAIAGEERVPETDLPDRVTGDMGIMLNREQGILAGSGMSYHVLPFAFFDYRRFYTRLDTAGVKTLSLGAGYLEISTRIKFDGYRAAGQPALTGLSDRQNSLPLGLGSMQLTEYGAFFLYAFHDFAASRGNLYETTYAARFTIGPTTLYPETGIEYYTSQYVQYYYGVTSRESALSGYQASSPGGAVMPFLSVLLEIPVEQRWHADIYGRVRWPGSAIAHSPMVNKWHLTSFFVAMVANFE